jgi:large subunit ribosomal protein L13
MIIGEPMKVIDAEGLILGRMASVIAKQLLTGDEVVVVNAEKALVTGSKKMVYAKYKKMRELSHARKGPHFPRMPDMILKRTIRGMIPYQKPRGRKAFKNLKVYIGLPKEFEGKKAESIKQAKGESISQYIVLGDVSRYLGAKF